MTDENTTPDDTTAAAPRVRRSRRATSPSGAAGSVEVTAVTVAPAAVGAPVVEAAPDAAPAKATRSRSRRATSAAAAPAAEAAPVVAPAEPAAPGEPAGTEAPAAPARRRRGRATDAAPAAVEADAAAEPVAQVEEIELADAAPKRATRSRSRSRSVAASAEEAAPALDVIAELGAPREPVVAEVATMSTTALLFQAPDPTSRPKRRRAMAPAGPPRPEDEDVEVTVPVGEDVAAQDEDEALVDAAADDEPDELDEDGGEQADEAGAARRRRRRGGRGRRSRSSGERAAGDEGDEPAAEQGEPEDSGEVDDTEDGEESDAGEGSASSRRRRRRRRGARPEGATDESAVAQTTSTRTRSRSGRTGSDEVTALKGSTRLEAKRQRRRDGRDQGRRRSIITESEFLARREAVARTMIVREAAGRVQIAVLEDGVLVEHFVSRSAQNAQSSTAGNVYLGRVQNVLPSMEAAFVDVGKGRNAVLYAGEVNWDAAGLEGQPRRIEQALKSGDPVLVQVTKDPIGHKGARLTSQITLAGRYLVYVPAGGMTGISRKLPENERARLKKILKEVVPDAAGVIVRTAAEGASEEELRRDVQRLQDQWAAIEKKAKGATAPALLQGEPDLAIRVVRDIFNDDFTSLVVQGDAAWDQIHEYVDAMAPDLADRVSRYVGTGDIFAEHRIDEQLAKGMDRKVWLPSGGSLVIDRTEAMTVVDVNTGKFTGTGGTLEETVTRNNLEAAEEIVRQLRLRDIGGIIVIDFIDMVLESNRDLVLRRLVECLGRDRTKHQVAEVTSLGLVQMTRKRVGQGLVEAFSETCVHCNGRGFLVHAEPVEARTGGESVDEAPEVGQPHGEPKRSRRKKPATGAASAVTVPVLPEAREAVKATLATIAAAAAHAHEHDHDHDVVVPEPTEVVEPTELEPTELEPVVEAEPVVEPVVEDEAQDQHDQHDQH